VVWFLPLIVGVVVCVEAEVHHLFVTMLGFCSIKGELVLLFEAESSKSLGINVKLRE
jgi:hypothetical protein